jgi:serine/threonine-protein kinase
VHAEAEGYEITEAQAVMVDPDVPTLHRVQFGASTRTGIEVRSNQTGYSLYLDGKLVGELPQRITGLSTGEHTLLVSGGEGYYAEEKKVVLEADEMLVLENIELKPRSGLLKIAGDSQLDGATVTLDGERIELPYDGQVDASKRHHLVAKRRGFEDFEAYVEFSATERERELNIQLMPKSAGDDSSNDGARASESRRSSASRGSRRATEAKTSSEPSEATGKAKLSLTSDPPANVLLDGKPIGRTPKMGLSVAAGTHTVLFVHPTLGRARASAKLEAGQSKTLRARF